MAVYYYKKFPLVACNRYCYIVITIRNVSIRVVLLYSNYDQKRFYQCGVMVITIRNVSINGVNVYINNVYILNKKS